MPKSLDRLEPVGASGMMIDEAARCIDAARFEADSSHAARLSTLGQMTASIAHEIRQPLSAILTNAETSLRWLAKPDPNLSKLAQLSERIAASAQRASDIIAGIQDMAGRRQLRHVQLDLNEVIREALGFLQRDIDERSIRVRLNLAANLPRMLGERTQLQQVLVNLLSNSAQALEATPPREREICVSTEPLGAASLTVSVCDTGPGIPPRDLERIFRGFFSTKDGGMGIGLAICRSIVAAHGGTIGAFNLPGRGAAFQIVLPVARRAGIPPVSPP